MNPCATDSNRKNCLLYAIDEEDGDVSSSIRSSQNLDLSTGACGINDVTRGSCIPGTYSYTYTASDSNENESEFEIIVKIVELGKMNTTITVGPYYSASSADTAAANYLKQGNSMRLAIESGLAQTLVAAGAGNFKASDVSVVYTEVTRSSKTTWSVYITCEISISTGQVTSSPPATKKRRRYRILLAEDASAIEGALSSIEASLAAAATSGALGSSLADASSAAGVESVPVSSEVTTTKVAVTKTVDLEASKLTAVKATVESISSRLSLLRSSVKRAQTNINENDKIDFGGYLTFNEKAWDASMEASLEEHAELSAYANEAFLLLNATVSVQETSNDALISIQERASELKTALESTLVLLNSISSGEDEVGLGASCEATNSCACPKRDEGEILVFFNATKEFTYIPLDFPASPPPPPPPSPPPSPPPVPLGCSAADFIKYGGCASAKEQKAKGRRLLRDLKYSGTSAQEIQSSSSSSSNVLDDSHSDKLYFGYDVTYKEKKEVQKEITYVPERKIRGKNTLIGGVLIMQFRSERSKGFDCSKRFPTLVASCRNFKKQSVQPFGVDPTFSRSSSLFGGVELEKNIGKYYNISELPASGVPNGFRVRSSDLNKGKSGFAVYLDIMMSKRQASRMISYMREGNYIDSSTESIVVNIAAYNPVTVRFTNTRVTFEYSKGGSVEIKSNTQALAVGIYDNFTGSLLLAMEVIVLCWVIYSTYALIADSVVASRSSDFEVLKKLEKSVVKIHSDVLEIVNLCCQLAAFIIWWIFQALYAYRFSPSKRYDVYQSVTEPAAHFMMPFKNQTGNDIQGGVYINGTKYTMPSRAKYNWELSEDTRGYENLTDMYDEINVMSNLQITYNLITGVNLLLLFVRFLLLLKFQPRLAIITKTFERSSVDIAHFLVVYLIFMVIAAVLGNTMFGHSIECVSSIESAFELLFLLLIGATSFTEFVPEGLTGNEFDLFFRIFYCGLIPIIFQWILFEFFVGILGDAFGDEKDILHDIEKTGDTLPNDLRKLAEYKMATFRKEWPKFEDVHDLLKSGIKLHEKEHQTKRVESDDDDDDNLKEDADEVNFEIITLLAKKFMKRDAGLYGTFDIDILIENMMKNKPVYENTQEELNEKLEKVRNMKLEMYRLLQKSINDLKEEMELYLVHQEAMAKRSETAALRWKRMKEFAEDIEIALENVTKETFDKKKLKMKVKELQLKRKEDEKAYEIKWNEALEMVKRYRNKPAKSIFDATRKLMRSNKLTNAKLQKAIALQRLYSGATRISQRTTNTNNDDSKNVDSELKVLKSLLSLKKK